MAKSSNTLLFFPPLLLLLLLLLTRPQPLKSHAEVSASAFNQNQNQQQNWAHLLPINYYSALNHQYYMRFRRQAQAPHSYPNRRLYAFEYARYV
ncbi:uncharacterized protein LOC115626290 [Scaptodrosophila lebanonensis]|uniref:Uncharacterized protein LOC115626290 n=1 Tax=Drosophila lebanonensis TaxID=7225 RepID=A0A6J2TPN8_DROLE|nr:uncharacterized protein LOC115626290 [Scaptodrosophila lebanonensis]